MGKAKKNAVKNKSMNKSELVSVIAQTGKMSKSEAERALNAVTESITSTLKGGQHITLVGFGTFGVNKRQARQGRNPKTGEPMQIKASNQPSFKAGS